MQQHNGPETISAQTLHDSKVPLSPFSGDVLQGEALTAPRCPFCTHTSIHTHTCAHLSVGLLPVRLLSCPLQGTPVLPTCAPSWSWGHGGVTPVPTLNLPPPTGSWSCSVRPQAPLHCNGQVSCAGLSPSPAAVLDCAHPGATVPQEAGPSSSGTRPTLAEAARSGGHLLGGLGSLSMNYSSLEARISMAPSSKGDPYLSARPSMNLRSMSPEIRKQLSAMVKRIVADSVSALACSWFMQHY